MIEFEKEYYKQPYYFYLKNRGDKFSVYFSVSETLVESRQNDEEIQFLNEDFGKVADFIKNLFSKGYKFTKEQIKKILNWIRGDKNKKKENKKEEEKDKIKGNDKDKSKEEKEDGEMKEFVGADGSFLGSNIPMRNQRQMTKNTMDQTVRMTKANQFPFIRVYYGESQEEKNNLIDEENFSDAYGWEEMQEKNIKTFKGCMKVYHDLGVKDKDEAKLRCESLGFDPELDEEGLQRIVELEKSKMKKMIDEILLNKKNKKDGVLKKNMIDNDNESSVMSKILIRNIEAIKKLANKEGISVDKLIKHLKTGE